MNLIFRTLILLVFTSYSYGQDCTNLLVGEIVDFHDKTPLANADVAVVGDSLRTRSDANGKFTLEGLCNGSIELEVSHPECISRFITVEINGNSFVNISLEHHLEELEEVEVTGELSREKTNSSQEESLRLSELERFGGSSLGDALRQINGVSSLNTGANIVKPVIQGLTGSRVLILNNGVRMQDMEWGEEHAPNVDINTAQKVTLVKGAAALQYGGDAIGGVIIMEPERIAPKDTLYGKTLVNVASNGRGSSVTTELTKAYKNGWFLKGQASNRRFGDLEAPDYILSNTGIAEIGFSLGFGKNGFVQGWNAFYSFFDTDIGILRASHIGNVDDLIQSINSGEPRVIDNFTYAIERPNQEVTHHLGKLTYYRRFEGKGKWTTQYDVQRNRRFEYDVRVGADRDKASIDLTLTTHTLSSDFKLDSSKDYTLHFGLLGRYQENFANPETEVRRLIPDYDKYDFGAFITGEYYWNSSLVFDAGLRYDFNRIDALKFYQTTRWEERNYNIDFADLVIDDQGTQLLTNPIFDYHNISATAGFQYKMKENTNVRFNYALAQRAPNPSELFSDGLHHSAARIELGNLRIGNETSNKLSLSIQKESEKWGYTVAPYANVINDFILLEPTGVEFTIRGAFPVWSYRQTNARLLGIDASAYSQWTENWRTDHRFSIVKGKDTDSDIALINIPAANIGNSLTYTRSDWNSLRISLESQYVFRQNEFPPDIMVFSPDTEEEQLLAINTPPPSYHLLGIDAEAVFGLVDKNDLTIGISVSNLLNTSFRDYLNRLRFFADDLGRNIAIRLKFNY